jgi:hypothetical protein
MEAVETYVGLDVHRKLVVATALDEGGKRIEQAQLTSAPQELIDFLARLPGRKRVAIEACAMWEPYFDTAEAAGAEVTLSHPLMTKLIAGASLKSDKVDSEALARLLRLDALPTSFAPPSELRRLRALVRDRLFYRRTWQSVANHVYHRLIRLGLAYEDGILHKIRKRTELRKLGEADIDRGLDTLEEIEGRVKELDPYGSSLAPPHPYPIPNPFPVEPLAFICPYQPPRDDATQARVRVALPSMRHKLSLEPGPLG